MFTGSRNTNVTIGITSSNVMQPSNRTVLSLRNSSTAGQVITIHLGELAAETNKGIVLSPGQAWVENTSENYKCWDGSVQAISDVAGAILSVFER